MIWLINLFTQINKMALAMTALGQIQNWLNKNKRIAQIVDNKYVHFQYSITQLLQEQSINLQTNQYDNIIANFTISVTPEIKIQIKAFISENSVLQIQKKKLIQQYLKKLNLRLKPQKIQLPPSNQYISFKTCIQLTEHSILHQLYFASLKYKITKLKSQIKNIYKFLKEIQNDNPLYKMAQKSLELLGASDKEELNFEQNKTNEMLKLKSDRKQKLFGHRTYFIKSDQFVRTIEQMFQEGVSQNKYIKLGKVISRFQGCNCVVQEVQLKCDLQIQSSSSGDNLPSYVLKKGEQLVMKRIPMKSEIREYYSQYNDDKAIQNVTIHTRERLIEEIEGIFFKRNMKRKLKHYLCYKNNGTNKHCDFLLMEKLTDLKIVIQQKDTLQHTLCQICFVSLQISQYIFESKELQFMNSDIKYENFLLVNLKPQESQETSKLVQIPAVVKIDDEGIRYTNNQLKSMIDKFPYVVDLNTQSIIHQYNQYKNLADFFCKIGTPYMKKITQKSEYYQITCDKFEENYINYVKHTQKILLRLITKSTPFLRPPMVQKLYNKIKNQNLIFQRDELKQLIDQYFDFYGFSKTIQKLLKITIQRFQRFFMSSKINKKTEAAILLLQKLNEKIQTKFGAERYLGKHNIERVPIIIQMIIDILK